MFCNCACFSDELLGSINEMAGSMRVGSFFISVTRPLSSLQFDLVESMTSETSWGRATIFIQQRKHIEEDSTVATSESMNIEGSNENFDED